MKKEMSISSDIISIYFELAYKSSVLLLMLQACYTNYDISIFYDVYISGVNQINIAGYDFTLNGSILFGDYTYSYFVFISWLEINDDVHSVIFFSILIKPVAFYKYYFCKMLGDRPVSFIIYHHSCHFILQCLLQEWVINHWNSYF